MFKRDNRRWDVFPESVDDILGGDGLALGVVGVDERVADDDVEEGLQDLAGLRVDGGGNALDSSTTRETADCGLCDPSEYVFVFRPVLFFLKFRITQALPHLHNFR